MIGRKERMEIQIHQSQHNKHPGNQSITGTLAQHRQEVSQVQSRPEVPTACQASGKAGPVQNVSSKTASRPPCLTGYQQPCSLVEIRVLGLTARSGWSGCPWQSPLPAKEPDPVGPSETEPGSQMQAHLCELRKGKNPRYAFVATLGFSRDAFVNFTTSQSFDVLRECHEDTFPVFGGVPREVLHEQHEDSSPGTATPSVKASTAFTLSCGIWPSTSASCRDCANPIGPRPRARSSRFQPLPPLQLRRSPVRCALNRWALVSTPATANIEVRKWLDDVAELPHSRRNQ